MNYFLNLKYVDIFDYIENTYDKKRLSLFSTIYLTVNVIVMGNYMMVQKAVSLFIQE